MKFLIDANLPYNLASVIKKIGFDVKHTIDLPDKEFTKDNFLLNLSVKENRIIITKDRDFLNSYYINQIPKKLLLINTGNISNSQLKKIFSEKFNSLIKYFNSHDLVILNKETVIYR